MKLNLSEYNYIKFKNYTKTNNLFFFCITVNKNFKTIRIRKQKLKMVNLNYNQLFNKTNILAIKSSIFNNMEQLVYSTTFFLKFNPNEKLFLTKSILTDNTLSFVAIISLKLNNRIYPLIYLKNVNIFDYFKYKLIIFQHKTTNLKFYLIHCTRNNVI